MIRAICFDLDDTLWPSRPVLEAAEGVFNAKIEALAPRLAQRYPPAKLREQRLALLKAQPELRHQISEWRRLSLELALRDCGYGDDSTAIAAEVFEHFIAARQQVSLYPHAEGVIKQLSESYQLVSLTNGNADFSAHPASAAFHTCIKAEDIGISKPDARAFEAALNSAGCAADEMIHIGDHPRDDIEGALNAGLRAIQALMPGIDRQINPLASTSFSDWRELPAQIEALAEGA